MRIPKAIQSLIESFQKLPGIGPLAKDSFLALLFVNFSLLIRSGIHVTRALELLKACVPYSFMSKKLKDCQEHIYGGLSLSEALAKDSFFPALSINVIQRGEELGMLGQYLGKLAEVYSKKSSQGVDGLMAAVQPVLLGICGIFILLLALSFLVPIYTNLTTIAQGGL